MLVVTNLSPSTTEASLRQLMQHLGSLLHCQLSIHPQTGTSAGVAHLMYATIQMSDQVVRRALAGQLQLDGRQLVVQFAAQPNQPQTTTHQPHHHYQQQQQQQAWA